MASQDEVILFGAGSYAVSVVDLVQSAGGKSIVGVLDDRVPEGDRFLNYPFLGGFDSLANWINAERCFIVSVGQIGMPGMKQTLFENLLSLHRDGSNCYKKRGIVRW